MTIPEYRNPPAQPASAIGQSRNWFLFRVNGEPMLYRRKAVWFIVPGNNIRQFVGDDYEPMGHLLSAKMPDPVKDVMQKAWADYANPPLALS